MVKNEVVFRTYNESVLKRFEELSDLAKNQGQEAFFESVALSEMPLHFYCECADENCRKRIQIKPRDYAKIHKQRDRFVIMRGHEVKTIERVVGEERGFCIVEKLLQPPAEALVLSSTDVNNT